MVLDRSYPFAEFGRDDVGFWGVDGVDGLGYGVYFVEDIEIVGVETVVVVDGLESPGEESLCFGVGWEIARM